MSVIPWTYDERPDTRISNVRLGMWIFLASEAMFFGSLFSAYVLLRAGAASWPDARDILDLRLALLNTALLAGSALCMLGSRNAGPGSSPALTYLAAGTGIAFLGIKLFEYQSKFAAGLHPSTNIFFACWFTLTAVHALHVAAGVGMNIWLAARTRMMQPRQAFERFRAARLYWIFVDALWIALLIAFYFV